MNTFKQKSLYAVVAGLSALGATGAAQAVSVNHDGLGQALIYPYYTVRESKVGADFQSLLSVVNSTGSAKAVKVRFLEGKNSREVLDFNLYLSAKDVWTGAIIKTSDGAAIFTKDTSCTTPKVGTSAATASKFVNFAYTGSAADKGPTDLDRTREGYVEIIEMGNVIGATAAAVTHGASGSPTCAGLSNNNNTSADTVAGNGGLFGSMTLINVLNGEDFAFDATALDGFSSRAIWNLPFSILPNLADVNPKTSVVVAGSTVYITDWSASSNTVDAVSAVLMHNNVYNEFVLETETKSGTDMVVTFPTKTLYYTGLTVSKLFQSNFGASGACDDISLFLYNREERFSETLPDFSPQPEGETAQICWEANVITLNDSNVFGSKNKVNVNTAFTSGWAALTFINPGPTKHRLVATGGAGTTTFNTKTGTQGFMSTATYYGLPVIGFAAVTFRNDTLTTPAGPVQSNYGGNVSHKVTTDIR